MEETKKQYKSEGKFGSGELKESTKRRNEENSYLDSVPPKVGAATQVLLSEAVRLYLGDAEILIANIRNSTEDKDWKIASTQIEGPLIQLRRNVDKLVRIIQKSDANLRLFSVRPKNDLNSERLKDSCKASCCEDPESDYEV